MNLSVITFNIRCCDDAGNNSIPERAPRLKRVLSDYNADIIGLQECTPRWLPLIEADYGGDYEIFNKYRSTDNRESAPLLWRRDRFSCLKTGFFWLSDTPDTESKGWDEKYDCYRICTYAVLTDKRSGTRFTFMNTHFGFGDKGQISSADLIYRRSRSISDSPALITGDFNMLPDSAGYERMSSYFTDVNAATTRDTRITYHGYNPGNGGELIDYCFVSNGVTPLSAERIDTVIDGKFPSDHYGIYFTLNI